MLEDHVQTFHFGDDGKIPNNPKLPLLVYSIVLPQTQNLAADCQRLFTRNEWQGIWVNGIYDYHHYHSTAHEILGVISGTAEVQFGGEKGKIIQIRQGDAVIIPAGVGHCKKRSSADFRVVGAYPTGQTWDLCTGQPGERPGVLRNIEAVPLPETDPIYGAHGPLIRLWSD
jgi:uncharacterized protein YjlB